MTISRRQMAGAGLGLGVGAGLAAGLGAGLGATPAYAAVEPFSLTAQRAKITLPDLPALGLTYIARLDLFDKAGDPAGRGTAGSSIVDLTLEGPVVLATVALQLADGEIHYQRVMNRFGEYPRAAVGAITGGTGAYQDIRGEVGITWLDDERIELEVRPATG